MQRKFAIPIKLFIQVMNTHFRIQTYIIERSDGIPAGNTTATRAKGLRLKIPEDLRNTQVDITGDLDPDISRVDSLRSDHLAIRIYPSGSRTRVLDTGSAAFTHDS